MSVDLQVTKTDSTASLVPGTSDTYTITVTNNGPDTVNSVTLTDTIPAALLGASFAPSTGAYDVTSGEWSGLSLASGQSVTMTLTGTIDPNATGTLTNTVTVSPPAGVIDTNPANDTASDTDTLTPEVDLVITKTDGKTSVAPGTLDTYTIVVTNNGPSTVSSVTLTDTIPAALLGASFAPSTGAYDVTSGEWSGLSLASGQSVTMTLTGTIDPNATGTLTNAVTVAPPAGVTDTNPADNTASDIDTLTPEVDLVITKTDGATSVVPGTSGNGYTITLTNNGPSTVSSVTLTDTIPPGLLNPVFGPPSAGSYDPGSGLWSGLSLASGQSVSITLSGVIDPNAAGTLTNAVTVAPPAGVTDTNPADNTASDTDTLTPQVDLVITKTDGATSVVPGTSDTYTMVVSNAGPSAVTGASVSDPLPAGVIGATWVATGFTGGGSVSGAANGSGALATTVDLPVNASVTFTFTTEINPSATGSFANTATVTPPAGTSDPNPANNSATDTDTLTPQVDLSITKTDGVTTVVPGTSTTYNIVVTNNGPSTAVDAAVTDLFPAGITADNWTAVASAGSSVAAANGTGNIATTVTLLPGGTATFTAVAQISPAAIVSLTNTASVAPPAGLTDTDPGNNTATDTDTIPTADLAIIKTDGAASVVPGTSDTYTIVVSNPGPSAVTGASVSDPLPAGVIGATWAATGFTGGGSVSGAANGSGALATTVDLPVNASVTFTFTPTINPSATGPFTNTATVTPPAGTSDPNPANNSATDTDTLTPQADVSITKTDGVTTVVPGTSTTYNIVVTNNGPSTAVDATVIDLFPAAITAANWTAVASAGSSVAVPSGFGNIFTPVTLLPGGFAIFTAVAQISPLATGSLTNTASVFGLTDTNPGNNTATDTDVLGTPAIQIVKFVNGQDADSPTGPHVAAGSTVTFTYVVTDTGPVPLANVVVIDDKLGPITSFTGDTNNSGLLDTTETWTYTATATALAGQQTNVGTVTALEPNTGTPVIDSNPANYFASQPTSDDFNGDGRGDVLFRHDSGEVYLWAMNGLQTEGEGRVALVTNDWHVQGVGDFNGDFNSDFLWRQDSGQVYFWEMNGLQIKEEGSPPHAPVPNDWHIEGTGDFDGDFKSDILWRHDSGQVYLWEMDGLNVKAEGSVTHAPVTTDWHVQGVGDFNGDGNSDVLWRQDDSGQTYIWQMNGQQVQAEGAVAHAAVPNDWHVQGIGDFNGDGNSDVLWRQDGSGQVYVWEMNGQQVQAEGAVAHAPLTTDWHVESVNDFNGDGNSDVLWRQDGSGQVYVWEMNGLQVTAEGAVAHAPVPSDWHIFSDQNFI